MWRNNTSKNNAPIFNNLGNTLKELGKINEAIRCYERAIQINTNYNISTI